MEKVRENARRPAVLAPDQAGGRGCPCRTELEVLLTAVAQAPPGVIAAGSVGETWSVRRAVGYCAGYQPSPAAPGGGQLPGNSFSRRG